MYIIMLLSTLFETLVSEITHFIKTNEKKTKNHIAVKIFLISITNF